MAILKDYGKSESDLGHWFPFGDEVPAAFDVRVRRVPYDVANRISKKYGKEVMVVSDGLRRPQIERTLDQTTQWLLDQAAFAWVDAKGLQIEVADEAAAKLWSGLLKSEVKEGEVIDLSGSLLTHEAKMRVLTQIRPFALATVVDEETGTARRERQDLASFIVLKASKLLQEGVKAEENASGN